ncbi:MAG: ABC transporter ATP-binding protein [Mycobacterium leprae]
MSVLRAQNLTRIYGGSRGAVAVKAVDSINLTVERGEFVGIMGPSGSGKTTLLQLLGSIDRPTAGEVYVNDQSLTALKGEQLALFRRRHLGFIFQDYNLLDALTIQENVMIPLVLAKRPVAEIEAKVNALAARMGIADVLAHHPYECSGGERQRAAAARALIHGPALVLADEPTGNLDSKSAKTLMESLAQLNADEAATILMVTHDPVSASYCRRILFIKDGRIYTELRAGADRPRFFQQILDVLSTLGGDQYDAAYAGR